MKRLLFSIAIVGGLSLSCLVCPANAQWQQQGYCDVILDGDPSLGGNASYTVGRTGNAGFLGASAGSNDEDGGAEGGCTVSGKVRVTYVWVGDGTPDEPGADLFDNYEEIASGSARKGGSPNGSGAGEASSSAADASGSISVGGSKPKDSYSQSDYSLPDQTQGPNPGVFYADVAVSAHAHSNCPVPVIVEGDAEGSGSVYPQGNP